MLSRVIQMLTSELRADSVCSHQKNKTLLRGQNSFNFSVLFGNQCTGIEMMSTEQLLLKNQDSQPVHSIRLEICFCRDVTLNIHKSNQEPAAQLCHFSDARQTKASINHPAGEYSQSSTNHSFSTMAFRVTNTRSSEIL